MKKWGEVTLGVVTSIGGFLEVGSITTASQGGAEFGYQLAWVLLLGIVSLAFLMEMTGRLAAVSRRTYVDLLRERFGMRFFVLPLFVLMNDGDTMLRNVNGWTSNLALAVISILSLARLVAALPLQIMGGGDMSGVRLVHEVLDA